MIEQPGFSIGFMEAAVDLSAAQYKCVKPTANGVVNLTTVAGENALGILQNKPVAGAACTIMCTGVSKVVAGTGGLAAGATWEAAANGTAITATTGKAGLGVVLFGASAGEIASVTVGFAQGGTLA